jgi:hypothetical protein
MRQHGTTITSDQDPGISDRNPGIGDHHRQESAITMLRNTQKNVTQVGEPVSQRLFFVRLSSF